MQLDVIDIWCGRSFLFVADIKTLPKTKFTHADRLRTAMQHNIEAHWARAVVASRNDHAIRLRRAINDRRISTQYLSFLFSPGTLVIRQCLSPFNAACQCFVNKLQIVCALRLIVAPRPNDAFVKDLDICQKIRIIRCQLRDLSLQLLHRVLRFSGRYCSRQ